MSVNWKRVLLGALGVGVLGCGGLLGYGALQPTAWRVETHRLIAATPADIHPLVDTPRELGRWLGGPEAEAAGMKLETFGPERGVGAGHTWDSPGTHGRFEITASDPARGITYAMVMEDSRTPAAGSISYDPQEGGTEVRWVDEGDLEMPIVGGLLARVMEKALGDHFEGALDRLAVLSEAARAEREAQEAREEAARKALPEPESDATPTEPLP